MFLIFSRKGVTLKYCWVFSFFSAPHLEISRSALPRASQKLREITNINTVITRHVTSLPKQIRQHAPQQPYKRDTTGWDTWKLCVCNWRQRRFCGWRIVNVVAQSNIFIAWRCIEGSSYETFTNQLRNYTNNFMCSLLISVPVV